MTAHKHHFINFDEGRICTRCSIREDELDQAMQA